MTIAAAGIPVAAAPIAFLAIADRSEWQMWPFVLCLTVLAAAVVGAVIYLEVSRRHPGRGH